jgi:hypothetical protein
VNLREVLDTHVSENTSFVEGYGHHPKLASRLRSSLDPPRGRDLAARSCHERLLAG